MSAISALLERAADQYLEDGVVDVAVQFDLAAEGYMLRGLNRDIHRVLEARKENH